MVNKCLVALGANLPTSTRAPIGLLRYALEVIEGESLSLTELSRWYSTPAFPAGSGPDYVNAVALFQTSLNADAVLKVLHQTENLLGRERTDRWGARVCDLDLLSFEDQIIPDQKTQSDWVTLPLERQMKDVPKELILPHPRIQDRAFVLVPLRDVAPDWVHPVTGMDVDKLISELKVDDVLSVQPIHDPDHSE